MNKLENIANDPENQIGKFARAAKIIEHFAKKASKEMKKGSILGYFYVAVTLILLSLFAILSIGFIIFVGSFFPEQYQLIVSILATIPVVAVIYFFIKSISKKESGSQDETNNKNRN